MVQRPQLGAAWVGACRVVFMDNDLFLNVHAWWWGSYDSSVLVGWAFFVGWCLVDGSCFFRIEQEAMRELR